MPLLTAVGVARVGWCAVIVIALFARGLEANDQPSVVRVLNSHIAEALAQSFAVSPTVRSLIEELERSDLIVHIQDLPIQRRRQLSGAMIFVHRAGGRRFLRIFVDQRLAPKLRAAALAHELQHAVEVARHEFVVDQATLAMLYRHIGYESGDAPDGRYYETDDAKRIGALVLADLRNVRTSAATSTAPAAARPGASVVRSSRR